MPSSNVPTPMRSSPPPAPPSPLDNNGLTPSDSSPSSTRNSLSKSPDRPDCPVALFSIDCGAVNHCKPTRKHGEHFKGQQRWSTKRKPRKLAGAPRLQSSYVEAESIASLRDRFRNEKFVSKHIFQAIHHTWQTPEVLAYLNSRWSMKEGILRFSFICNPVAPRREPPQDASAHYRQESLAMFNKYIVEALGLRFTRTEKRDELFDKWLALRSTFPWFVSLDARVEIFLKGLRIDGRVWSMTREEARYDAEYVVPEYLLIDNFCLCDLSILESKTLLRHMAFSATFPLEDEWWGEDSEGSFSWYVKHVAKVAAVRGTDHRTEMVEKYCDWCEHEELREKWIFAKRYARRWFPGSTVNALRGFYFAL